MARYRFINLQFFLFACLLLGTLFESTAACGQTRRRSRRPYHYYRYETTTERYYGKRSVDNIEHNEIGVDLYESSNTNCGRALCPKVVNYPTDEIIDAVDRLHQYLRDNGNYFTIQGISHDLFVTSERTKTLSRRPHDHWFLTNPSSGCKQHASVNFPQEGSPIYDYQSYYIVNVPNLRQSLVEYTCNNVDQTCSKDKTIGALQSDRKCEQKYGVKHFVVLPRNKRYFNDYDFQVKKFVVPESCVCGVSRNDENENMIL